MQTLKTHKEDPNATMSRGTRHKITLKLLNSLVASSRSKAVIRPRSCGREVRMTGRTSVVLQNVFTSSTLFSVTCHISRPSLSPSRNTMFRAAPLQTMSMIYKSCADAAPSTSSKIVALFLLSRLPPSASAVVALLRNTALHSRRASPENSPGFPSSHVSTPTSVSCLSAANSLAVHYLLWASSACRSTICLVKTVQRRGELLLQRSHGFFRAMANFWPHQFWPTPSLAIPTFGQVGTKPSLAKRNLAKPTCLAKLIRISDLMFWANFCVWPLLGLPGPSSSLPTNPGHLLSRTSPPQDRPPKTPPSPGTAHLPPGPPTPPQDRPLPLTQDRPPLLTQDRPPPLTQDRPPPLTQDRPTSSHPGLPTSSHPGLPTPPQDCPPLPRTAHSSPGPPTPPQDRPNVHVWSSRAVV